MKTVVLDEKLKTKPYLKKSLTRYLDLGNTKMSNQLKLKYFN